MAPWSTGSGRHPLKVEKRVRFPPGLFRVSSLSFLCAHEVSDFPGAVGRTRSTSRLARLNTGAWDMRVGWCSAEFHTLGCRGSTPGPAINLECDLA